LTSDEKKKQTATATETRKRRRSRWRRPARLQIRAQKRPRAVAPPRDTLAGFRGASGGDAGSCCSDP
jgi:hypothetical protein